MNNIDGNRKILYHPYLTIQTRLTFAMNHVTQEDTGFPS
jgi:hypothetical protein